MAPEILGLIIIVLMFILIFMRVPIAISLIVPGIIGIMMIRGWKATETALETITWSQSFSYTLSAIPMFILMGELMYVSGISSELYSAFKKWFGNFRGGLATSTVGASALFAAASGSSVASTGTMGVIAYREMKKYGYNDNFSSGTIVSGGTLGILIPPSGAFIIYGIITEQSIGKLFMAGIVPGIILTILFMLTVIISIWLKPELAPAKSEKVPLKEKLKALNETIWFLILITFVIGGMYLGWFSPTESAGIGAIGATIIAIIKKKLTIKKFIQSLERTLRTTAFMFAIIIGAFILNYFLALTGLPTMLANFVSSMNIPAWGTMLVILAMYIFLGAVMEALAMIVVTIPIILPLVEALGFDLIWFGVFIVIIIELALITPPIGMNCFVLKGAVPELKLEDIFKGAVRFYVPILVLILLIMIFPELALWIPNTM